MKPDGRVDLRAVLCSLLVQAEASFPNLIVTGWDAERSFGALLRAPPARSGSRGLDLGQLAVDVT